MWRACFVIYSGLPRENRVLGLETLKIKSFLCTSHNPNLQERVSDEINLLVDEMANRTSTPTQSVKTDYEYDPFADSLY